MNNQDTVYAHSKGSVVGDWQSLTEHSQNVAMLASSFATAFNSRELAGLLGNTHDLGKVRASFQSYIRHCNGIDTEEWDYGNHTHSGAGMVWMWNNGNLMKALAYCIAGHHAGLPDWSGGKMPDGALGMRLAHEAATLEEPPVRDWIAEHKAQWCSGKKYSPPFIFSRYDSSVSFWIRMMYSCLVDADFLDTEAFMDSERASLRTTSTSLAVLAERFFAKLDEKQHSAFDTPVNRIRADIRSACEKAANFTPGLFSLTVPTGGGKTLSSTAFAFKHALHHELKRIIYVIPYTSIIEQTADVLRDFIGSDSVLEHHSNFDVAKETPQSRLASENWDAPIIVTTAVQFFESLYACRSSQCRKLHNIAESVVILDEVQLLPIHLLLPCAEAIRQLSLHYRTSIVLSTATQLNLPGIDVSSIREMTPSDLDLYHRLKRTEIEFPTNLRERRSWDDIAVELLSHEQILCIVNTRRQCHDLFCKMPEGTIHLSASMCGAHRSAVIADIKQKLAEGKPIRVISTQLVEAGVDVDFPIVYRAFAGLSSVAQSAGRCNREGRLNRYGKVIVFMPPDETHVKDLRDGEYAMSELLERPGGIDADEANSYPEYFKALHSRANDLGTAFEHMLGVSIPQQFRHGVAQPADPMHYQFREAASAFQMIDGYMQVPIIVRYNENDKLINSLRAIGPKRDIMRLLQRYTVNVPRQRITDLLQKGMIEEMGVPPNYNEPSGIYVQTAPSVYHADIGLDIFGEGLKTEDYQI